MEMKSNLSSQTVKWPSCAVSFSFCLRWITVISLNCWRLQTVRFVAEMTWTNFSFVRDRLRCAPKFLQSPTLLIFLWPEHWLPFFFPTVKMTLPSRRVTCLRHFESNTLWHFLITDDFLSLFFCGKKSSRCSWQNRLSNSWLCVGVKSAY